MKLFEKGSKFYSIFRFKCPRCQVGDLYETTTFSFKKPFEMPPNCPECHQKYFLEPGFYYGAMFISYFMTGGFCLAFVGFSMLVLGFSINLSFMILIAVLTVLFVWIFRLARAIWININVKYDSQAVTKEKV